MNRVLVACICVAMLPFGMLAQSTEHTEGAPVNPAPPADLSIEPAVIGVDPAAPPLPTPPVPASCPAFKFSHTVVPAAGVWPNQHGDAENWLPVVIDMSVTEGSPLPRTVNVVLRRTPGSASSAMPMGAGGARDVTWRMKRVTAAPRLFRKAGILLAPAETIWFRFDSGFDAGNAASLDCRSEWMSYTAPADLSSLAEQFPASHGALDHDQDRPREPTRTTGPATQLSCAGIQWSSEMAQVRGPQFDASQHPHAVGFALANPAAVLDWVILNLHAQAQHEVVTMHMSRVSSADAPNNFELVPLPVPPGTVLNYWFSFRVKRDGETVDCDTTPLEYIRPAQVQAEAPAAPKCSALPFAHAIEPIAEMPGYQKVRWEAQGENFETLQSVEVTLMVNGGKQYREHMWQVTDRLGEFGAIPLHAGDVLEYRFHYVASIGGRLVSCDSPWFVKTV